MDCIAFSGAGL